MCVCVCVSAYDSVIKYHSILLALQVLIYLICCNNIEERIDNHPPHSKYHVGTSRTSLRTFKLIKKPIKSSNQSINQADKKHFWSANYQLQAYLPCFQAADVNANKLFFFSFNFRINAGVT